MTSAFLSGVGARLLALACAVAMVVPMAGSSPPSAIASTAPTERCETEGVAGGQITVVGDENGHEGIGADGLVGLAKCPNGDLAYRPGELIIRTSETDNPNTVANIAAGDDAERQLREALAKIGIDPRNVPMRCASETPGWALCKIPPEPLREGLSVPDLIAELRPYIDVAPNQVLAAPFHHGGPAGAPQPAPKLPMPTGNAGRGATVVVLDTGNAAHLARSGANGSDEIDRVDETRYFFWQALGSLNSPKVSEYLGKLKQLYPELRDVDLPEALRSWGGGFVWANEPDGYPDRHAGHGAFIDGIIKQVAPAANVIHRRVLSSNGVGDVDALATAVEKLVDDPDIKDLSIVNMSLGTYRRTVPARSAHSRALSATAFGRFNQALKRLKKKCNCSGGDWCWGYPGVAGEGVA